MYVGTLKCATQCNEIEIMYSYFYFLMMSAHYFWGTHVFITYSMQIPIIKKDLDGVVIFCLRSRKTRITSNLRKYTWRRTESASYCYEQASYTLRFFLLYKLRELCNEYENFFRKLYFIDFSSPKRFLISAAFIFFCSNTAVPLSIICYRQE